MNTQLSLIDLGTLFVSLLVAGGAHLALRQRAGFSAREGAFFRAGVVALTLGLVLDLVVNDVVGRLAVAAPPAAAPTATVAALPAITFASYLAVKFFVVAALGRLSLLLLRR